MRELKKVNISTDLKSHDIELLMSVKFDFKNQTKLSVKLMELSVPCRILSIALSIEFVRLEFIVYILVEHQ